MLSFTDFVILPDTLVGIGFSLDKGVLKHHELRQLPCKDTNRIVTEKRHKWSVSVGNGVQSQSDR